MSGDIIPGEFSCTEAKEDWKNKGQDSRVGMGAVCGVQ